MHTEERLGLKGLSKMATIEHIYFRWDIRRALSEETILACYKCNQIKTEEDNKKMWEGFDYSHQDIINIKDLRWEK